MGTFFTGLVLLVIVCAIVFKIRRDMKKGGCSGGCSSCPNPCHSKEQAWALLAFHAEIPAFHVVPLEKYRKMYIITYNRINLRGLREKNAK